MMEENRVIKSWKLSSRHVVYRNAVLGYFSTLDLKENCSEKLYVNAELGFSTKEYLRVVQNFAMVDHHLQWYNGKIQCWPSINF
jgi:hypothetical protein